VSCSPASASARAEAGAKVVQPRARSRRRTYRGWRTERAAASWSRPAASDRRGCRRRMAAPCSSPAAGRQHRPRCRPGRATAPGARRRRVRPAGCPGVVRHGCPGEVVHPLVRTAPPAAQLLPVAGQMIRAAADRGLEPVGGGLLPDLRAASGDLQKVPGGRPRRAGARPGRTAAPGRSATVRGRARTVPAARTWPSRGYGLPGPPDVPGAESSGGRAESGPAVTIPGIRFSTRRSPSAPRPPARLLAVPGRSRGREQRLADLRPPAGRGTRRRRVAVAVAHPGVRRRASNSVRRRRTGGIRQPPRTSTAPRSTYRGRPPR
jgi:hypothetical protein